VKANPIPGWLALVNAIVAWRPANFYMKTLIKNGHLLDPASGMDCVASLAIENGRISAVGVQTDSFQSDQVLDATGCVVCPGLIDLSVNLLNPAQEGLLASELGAAVAGGITTLVCPPDTDPPLDETGLINLLKHRTSNFQQTHVYPLGALTRGLQGTALTEMVELHEAGCVGFSQAEFPVTDTLVLLRSLQYASTYGYTVWLRPQDAYLSSGVAASGALSTRLGLSGVPVLSETIALHQIFDLVRVTGAHVHLCRLSSAAGVQLVRQAKSEGLPLTCDVSINHLHLIDMDIGYFNTDMRLSPPLRQQRDRDALRQGLADGTIDAVVSDHRPVTDDEKNRPFAEAEPGATGLELLLGSVLKWAAQEGIPLIQALGAITHRPAQVLVPALGPSSHGLGSLCVGAAADLCVFDPEHHQILQAQHLCSRSKHSPLLGFEWPGKIHYTFVGGRLAYVAGCNNYTSRTSRT
jgi:dihydroorotase